MGIFANAADKVKAEQEAAGFKWTPPPVMTKPEPARPVYPVFALRDGREYEPQYLAGRCCSGAEGGGGWFYHAVVVGSDAALCGSKSGWRSAGFARPAPHKEAVVTCRRCLTKIEKGKS